LQLKESFDIVELYKRERLHESRNHQASG
jgi:hypothetical protein